MATRSQAFMFMESVRQGFNDGEKLQSFLTLVKRLQSHLRNTIGSAQEGKQEIVGLIMQMKEMLKDHSGLVKGLNAFLPRAYRILNTETTTGSDYAMLFATKVQKRFQNDPEVCLRFWSSLDLYRKGAITMAQGVTEVQELFCNDPDLLEEFNIFCTNKITDPTTNDQQENKKTDYGNVACVARPATYEKGETSRAMVSDVELGQKGKKRAMTEADLGVRTSKRPRMTTRCMGSASNAPTKRRNTENKGLVTEELPPGYCTPSYMMLPQNGEAAESVLNNTCVLAAPEGMVFKPRLINNPAERKLFTAEDDMFGADLEIGRLKSAIKCFKEFLKKVDEEGDDKELKIDDFWTAIHRSSISELYGNHGQTVIQVIRKDPVETLPVLLGRLRQKCKECEAARAESNSQQKEVFTKNHKKALDLRRHLS